MAAKSQNRVSAKGSKSGGSGSSLSAKSDSKGNRKKVTLEDEEEEKESLAFKVLTAEQTNELLGFNVLQIQDKLKEIFNLDNYTINLTDAAILDYYTAAVYWGIQQKFTAQQLSGFFTVMHKLLDNVREKHLSLVDNTMEFNKLFAGIGVEEVKSAGLDFFNLEHVRAISEYVYSSLFQQYRLYLYMFTHSQAEEIIGTDLEVEVAKAADLPFPPPLDEGVEEMIYSEFIATPPPTPTPEKPSNEIKPKEKDQPRALSPKQRPRSRASTPKSPPSRGGSARFRASTPKSPQSRGGSPRSRGSSPKSPKRRSISGGCGSRSPISPAKGSVKPPEEEPDPTQELEDKVSTSDLFAQLTSQDVREVIESVTMEMLGNLQSEIGQKLQDKESQIIQRINKIHKVAE